MARRRAVTWKVSRHHETAKAGPVRLIVNTRYGHPLNTDVKLVLNHYTPVANLLSVPALMRELALAHHHDEALDLDAFIHRLATLHPKHAVLADLHAHVRVVRQEMRGALVDALRGDVGLQAALRMVAVLRRMGGANTSTSASASDEVALRGAFLRARAVYLWQVVGRAGTVDATNTIATGTDGSPSVPSSPLTATPLVAMDPASAEAFTFVKRFVETFRATFIDIITQYQAIFVTSPTPTAYRQHQQQPLASSITGKYRPSLSPPSDTTATAILSSFVWHTLRRFHATLALHIERITDTAQLATLLTQTMHLGVALGRKGVEMRFAVRTMFEQRCRRVVEEMIASGVDDFRDEIKACGMSSMMATTAKAQVVAATASTVTSAFQAPVVLLDYPPLAALTNVYLSAFTALRALPIATLRHPLVDAIHNSFDELAATLRTYSLSPRISASVATGSGVAMSERAVFTGLVRVMHDVWAPYVIRCLSDGVYGSLSRATDGVNTTTPSLRGFSELIVLAGV